MALHSKVLRFTALIASLILVITLFSGCSLIAVDKVKDDAEVIAQVGSESITKSTYRLYYNSWLSFYAMYGIPAPTEGESKQKLMQQVLDSMVDQAVLVDQAKALGYDKLSEEDSAKVEADAQSTYQSAWDQVSQAMTAQGVTGAELKAKTQQVLDEEYLSLDAIRLETLNDFLSGKVREETIKDVVVSDERVKEVFDKQVTDEEAAYNESPASYVQNLSSGTAIAWNPPGVRTVKHVQIAYPQENKDEIAGLVAQKSSYESQRDTLSAEDAQTATGGSAEDTEAALKAINDSLDEITAKLEDANARAKAAIETKVDAVFALAKDGGDFDALITEYGEDPGMTQEPYKTKGYTIFNGQTMYDAKFVEAGMALATFGEVSEPVYTSFGAHIVRYDSDVPAGPVDMQTVSESIRTSELSSAQNDLLTAKITEWKSKLAIKTYLNRADV